MKTAFLFPGQGSQAVGMCKDLYEQYAVVRDTFAEADDALGFKISELIFNGPEDQLVLTVNTQPAILTASVATQRVLAEKGITCDVAAGHSLGEYSALVAAGVLSFRDAVRTVRARGQYMQEAVPVGEGGMAAVLGLTQEQVVEVCQRVEQETGEAVQGVNFNCPGQIVIAGSTKGVAAATEALKAAGAKRAVPLAVSAPFHSSLLQPAADRLAVVLDGDAFHDGAFPVYANVTAKPLTDAAEIKRLLVLQAARPVQWENSVKAMIADGVDTFVEVGPGKVLSGFLKRIDRKQKSLNVEDLESLEKTLAYFEEVR